MWFIILLITIFFYEVFYFSIGEAVMMGVSMLLSFQYLKSWYVGATLSTRFFHSNIRRLILYCLPLLIILLYHKTLRTAASYDVISAGPYIFFYVFLGIAWLYLALQGMFLFFDFSYRDDVLTGNHTAPLITCICAAFAAALIYAGANIGDGPGWWTVVFAGGLGTVTWLLLGGIVHRATGLVERVIMDKEINSSIRLGGFLLAVGIILARASSGDWTSFGATVIEFGMGWPAIPLTVLVILLENTIFKNQAGKEGDGRNKSCLASIIVSLIYLLLASGMPERLLTALMHGS